MPKNILIFADGTGNESGLMPDESRTNVYKLYRATRTGPDSSIDPAKQVAFYIHGIGTPEPGKPMRLIDHIHQMFGGGLTKRIIDGYSSVISVWRPGDRIFLFGFSRGAYTARCLGHVIELFGIPTQDQQGKAISLQPKDLRAISRGAVRALYLCGYAKKESPKRTADIEAFRKTFACQATAAAPYFIGVWDTVAAVGWSRLLRRGYDLHLPKSVHFARHAMAIDEYRKDFARVPWGGSNLPPSHEGEPEPFQQVWFAGNHSDIGGSYPENESRLSDISLKWMADFIETEIPAEAHVEIDHRVLALYPSCEGMMHDECMVGVGGLPVKWYPADRNVPADAVLHATVYQRLELEAVRNFSTYGPYRPAPLRNHSIAGKYFPPTNPSS
ncbi:DUF2235 domain-containing protein [Mesorhizobium sp. WSM4310]|uniref:DUF2235 domain-containing protein n=1 Tax=Mesorhizobium sp. WSM4310 TaxID=2589883 RepID=UPI00115DF7BD|nr:DUF2235 domain-containing protein [Mesorhizobium sp. WSM4310]TRC89699.1 DUF2235 domain-containing protein [Mesorhizobium sp. WSM4310]